MSGVSEWSADCRRMNLIILQINDTTTLKGVSKGADIYTLENSVLTEYCKDKDKENHTKILYSS